MNKVKTVPALRFKEFTNSLFKNFLGNTSDIRDGTHESPKYFSNGFPLITSKNLLKNGKLDLDNVNFISEKDFISINKRSGVNVGDILFGMIGTIGNPVRIESSEFAIKNVALIKEIEVLENQFLIYYLNTENIKRQFYKENMGGTQKFIALCAIRKLKINFPGKEEQQKIATFLTAVDKKLELLKQKKEAMEKYKRGVMQKIFNQETRFKDENGEDFAEWEEKKLGEVIEICSSKRVLQSDWQKSGIPFLRTREVINLSNNKLFSTPVFITRTLFEELKFKYGVPKSGDILATGVGSIGELYIVKESDEFYFKDGNVLWFKMNSKLNSNFLDQFFKTKYIRKQLFDNASITTVATFTIEGAKSTKIKLPSLPEQQKIASFLSSLDQKIESLGKEIVLAEKWKKGLLEKMFI